MEKEMFQGREADQTLPSFLLPGSTPPPFWLKDVTITDSLSPVGMGERQKRENKQAISQPGVMLWETASSAAL